MKNNRKELNLLRVRSGNMDTNGKQKMTCSSTISTGFNREQGEAKIPISRSGLARRTSPKNGTDIISSNAATNTSNNQRYLILDPAQPIDEKSSLKRTMSQAIEPENGLHNEEFPEVLPIAVSHNSLVLQKNSSECSVRYLSSWDLMMAKKLKDQGKNSQERKRWFYRKRFQEKSRW